PAAGAIETSGAPIAVPAVAARGADCGRVAPRAARGCIAAASAGPGQAGADRAPDQCQPVPAVVSDPATLAPVAAEACPRLPASRADPTAAASRGIAPA